MTRFAIPSLMVIDSPRAEGSVVDPLMRYHFDLAGVMHLRSPTAEAEGDTPTAPTLVDHGLTVLGLVERFSLIRGSFVNNVNLEDWTIVSGDNQPGHVELDVWVNTNGEPATIEDSICDGAYPTIPLGNSRSTGTASAFSRRQFSAGDQFAVHVRELTDINSIFFILT